MGIGWNISGLSAITRVPKNIYYDGAVSPVTNTSSDVFALDGTRLIPTGTSSTFKFETDNFSTITSYDAGPNRWWRVKTKEGIEMDYGSGSDSRLLNDGNTEVMAWRIKRIKDVNDNYIEFLYTNVTGSGAGSPKNILIDKIVYTKNDGAALSTPYNEIKFNYTTAPFNTTVYEAGSAILLNRLLTSIEVRGENNQLVKTYVFNYGHNNIGVYLKEIKEKDGSGNEMNSTIFKYGDGDGTAIQIEQGNVNAYTPNKYVIYQFLDLQGDGIKELITTTGSLVNGNEVVSSFQIYSRDQSTGSYSLAKTIPYSTATTVKLGNTLRSQCESFQMADFNGDGREDILVFEVTPNSNYLKIDKVTIFLGDQANYVQSTTTPISLTPSTLWKGNTIPGNVCATKPQNHPEMFTGDFDGDGKSEVIVFLENTSVGPWSDHYPVMFSLQSGQIVQEPVDYIYFGGLGHENFKGEVIDIDGDGRNELMLRGQNVTKIYRINKATNYYWASQMGADLTWPTDYHNILLGDFNGDRKTDLLLQWGDGSQWEKGISDGKSFVYNSFNSFVHHPKTYNVNTGYPSEHDHILTGDFNGDGKSDIVQIRGSYTNQIYTYFSRGDDFYSVLNTSWNPRPWDIVANVSDINGDGKTDIISRSLLTANGTWYFFYEKDKPISLLHSVKDGFARTIDFTYKPLSKGGSFYTKGNSMNYPLTDLQVPFYAVETMKQPNGIGGFSQTNYSYNEALFHLEGRGFLGFKKVTATNTTLDTKTESLFDIKTTAVGNKTYYFMSKIEDKQYVLSTNQLLSNTTYNTQFQNTTGACFFEKINSITQNNTLTGASTTTTNTYNNNGSVTQQTVNVNNVEQTTTNTSYTLTANGLEKPLSVTVTRKRLTEPAVSDQTTFSYDALGRLSMKTDFANKPKTVVTSYSYDPFGNLASETISGTSVPHTATTIYEYDTKGRFPVKVKNPLNQETITTWHPVWGKPLEVTGIDNVRTTNTYNSWGKLTSSTVSYYNTIPAYTISYTDGWDLTKGGWFTKVTHPGRPDVKTWYDLLGREIETETEHYNNQKIYSTKAYDSKGQCTTTVRPHLLSEPAVATTYSYNNLGLLSATSDVYGNTTHSYSYGNGKTTTTVSGS